MSRLDDKTLLDMHTKRREDVLAAIRYARRAAYEAELVGAKDNEANLAVIIGLLEVEAKKCDLWVKEFQKVTA